MFVIMQITLSPKTQISLVGKEGYVDDVLWLMVCTFSDLNLCDPSVAAQSKMMKLTFTLPGI